MKKLLLPLILLALAACNQQPKADYVTDPAQYVDPFIGTGGHGHTFPGATVPFGMVQFSPDTRMNDWDGCSGYHTSDNTILGFSTTHLSGTGCSDYGDFRFMPIAGEFMLNHDLPNEKYPYYDSVYSNATFRHEDENAQAGFYSVVLDDGVKVELTAGDRVGMMRCTYPKDSGQFLLLDMLHGVNDEFVYEAKVNVENDHAISGFRRTRDWANDQYLYFYAEFSRPFAVQNYDWPLYFDYTKYSDAQSEKKQELNDNDTKVWFLFPEANDEQITMRIALSAVDVEGAKNNLKAELAENDFDFDALKQKAFDKWNTELKRYEVSDPNESNKTVFYTALYHCMIAPNLFSDADGRYRAHDLKVYKSDRPVYTVFSLWDTFRSLHPLFSLMQRERTLDFINTFINKYETNPHHLLPIWELAANETYCMIGNHAIPVIADAYFAGIRDFDTEKALEAMVASSKDDFRGMGAYMKYGYIPIEVEGEATSKTLEYAYDDWCVARMAEAMGKTDIAKEFYARAQNYKNIYNTQNQFFQGRRNGGWMKPFDPAQVNFTLTEANSYQYGFFVPQDVNGHIDLMGGTDSYKAKLDALFNAPTNLTGRVQPDITGLIGQYAHGNEPSHNTVYMYNFVGQPTKTQKYVKQVMDDFYTDRRDGYSGNEDCGQMSAWAVFSCMGFYPATPASGYYVLGVPRFERTKLTFENGKQFEVVAKNLSEQNCFVKTVKLNGKPLERSYITFEEVYNGGTLEFTMTDQTNSTWATQPENCPVMRIPTESIVIVPTINANSDTFFDSLMVSMNHPVEGVGIYYTLDGSDPRENGMLYDQPLCLKENTTVRAAAKQGDYWSCVIDAEYYLIDANRSVKLQNMYNEQYEAGGVKALIDHLRGGENFRTGAWQGYYGVDLIATVDLGQSKKINRLAGSFLQEVYSWIWMPTEVEYFVSDDGKNFRSVGKVKNEVPIDADGAFIQEMEVRPRTNARYVKMMAKTIGTCPEGHVGAGQKAWIFCDEFVIE
ncbi:MAG: GH92 family glycosyl hydrolase [Bacteroidales bacterium]|nr:GH92 family glycosyl hydrolase [Bacteroidales bacterium]MBR6930885.1 GH92 family glycosyl hydrolase [Bacteroidales bacterium]